jgi:hypothetical protein
MTTRSGTASGLSPADIDRIRRNLAGGRRPKVRFTESAGQIAGQPGQVVKLTDPDRSDDWLVVRFGRDELPFSPADLSLPPRARPGAGADRAAGTAGSGHPPADHQIPGPSPGPVNGSAPAGGPAGPVGAGPAPPPRTAADQVRKPAKRAARPARVTRPRPPASITVTLAYQSGEWTVAAHQGSRILAKPCLVRPAEALKMVAMLDVPGVHDAVEQIFTAELTEVQRRADLLRRELAEVEARLSELRDVN